MGRRLLLLAEIDPDGEFTGNAWVLVGQAVVRTVLAVALPTLRAESRLRDPYGSEFGLQAHENTSAAFHNQPWNHKSPDQCQT